MNNGKIRYGLEFDNAHNLHWYVGIHLTASRVFLSIARHKISKSPSVEAVLLPFHNVTDPITKKEIQINVMGRYFFIGTKNAVQSDHEFGLKSLGSIIIMCDAAKNPVEVNVQDIQRVIWTHRHKKKDTLQEYVNVLIRGGSLKNWVGQVTDKPHEETVLVNFQTGDYNFETDMPISLCEAV